MIRVLEFTDFINRYDFIDSIVQFADPSRFEVSVCVRSEKSNIALPVFRGGTKYAYFPGNKRSDALQTAWKLSRLLKEWQIDILHAHHFEQAVVGWLATRLYRRTRLLVGRHYSDSIYRNPSLIKRLALLAIEQKINHDATRIIVPSRMIFDILTKRQQIPGQKIDVVRYGFVSEKYKHPSAGEINKVRDEFGIHGRFTVANFGRYHEEKGHRYLVNAVAQLRSTIPEILVLCVGEGPERSSIEKQIATLGLERNVVLTGWRKDALSIMAAANIVAQSTLQEAFSQVMCEAMWMSRPLIMTDVSGARDAIVHGENGLIIPKGDSTALAGAIQRFVQDDSLGRKLETEGRRFVLENLAIEKQIKEYEAAFEQAITI